MNIKAKDVVELKRAIRRSEDAEYGLKGETGVVVEVFRPQSQAGGGILKPWHAKVRMDRGGKIKTFRLTSLSRIRTTA